jgi:mannose-6-phosphate isomerase-like protein (cupin superfamily)
MQLSSINDLLDMENPDFDKNLVVRELVRGNDFGIAGGILSPHSEGTHHYHKLHESVVVCVAGEAVEIVEGKEISLKEKDILYIAPGEKHKMMNRSDKPLRYLEMQIPAPDRTDTVLVE